MLQDQLLAKKKASAVSSVLSLATLVATRIKHGEKLFSRGGDGEAERIFIPGQTPEESASSQTPADGANQTPLEPASVHDWGFPDASPEP